MGGSNPLVSSVKRAPSAFGDLSSDMYRSFGKNTLESTGQVLLDTVTLGQSYSARSAKKSQKEMLKEARDQQAAQVEALRKQGSAPTMIAPSESETMVNKRKRLEALRAGLATTINTSSSGVAGSGSSRPSGKAKLGE